MEEYDRALELGTESLESQGSAMDKYAIYQKSLEANTKSLKSAWVDFVNELNANGFIDDLIEIGKAIMDVIVKFVEWSKTVKNFGVKLAVLAMILSAVMFAFTGKGLGIFIVSLGSLIVSLTQGEEALTDLNDSIDKNNTTTETATETTKEYAEALDNLKAQLKGQASGITNLISLNETENAELEKQKDLEEKLLAVEKARQALAEAKTKKVRVFRAGVGFTYETDYSEVQSAQETLDKSLGELSEYKYELAKKRAEEFVTELTTLLASGDIITGWDNLFTEFSDLLDSEFADYLLQAKNFVSQFNSIVGTSGMNVETDYSGVPAYANGTSSASGGVSLVGEQGAELRVMNRGDGVIPANATQNLLRMAQNPSQFVTNSNKSTTLQFSGNLSFPNVKSETDAKGFVSALLAIGNNSVAKFN